ncbi:Cold shock domain-containing protein E1 [Pleodorina starrii]|uniref:Cold shock domain-containing protein E1 n=1 Tax=Pleodorina starrii TaxID=330485 RepID=A0A9W6BAD9_9CHLO|nr:Cold shock domain-containing protein E1 [Pleodorina starrii]GLC48476.1 Cold shock domain-containing protein E1 [Pleodorina starrii]GLC71796.1 Cold shock domain-containing protein E1 [Pleodorina starrii]
MENGAVVKQGVVAMMRRNFGFIACPHRVGDVFFHQTSLEDCSMEQLTEGTAVTFVLEPTDGDKPVAKRVRLAPVGSRVRLTQLEPGMYLGQVSDPASGDSRGVIRFINPDGAPEHLLYDTADMQQQPTTLHDAPPHGSPTPPSVASSSQPHHPPPVAPAVAAATNGAAPSVHQQHPAQPEPRPAAQLPQPRHPPALVKGQYVFFRIETDTRAAQLAREAAARGGPPARPIAYQRAVELRAVAAGELSSRPQLQRQADLLELLEAAVQASRAAKAEGNAPQQPR